MSEKKTILDFQRMKEEGEKVAWITAYDFPTASFAEKAGMDMILVGDSLGMVVKGYEGTEPVTMEDCISHSQDVRRGAPNTYCIGDMPFMSYQVSCEEAVANAGRFIKEADMDAIKLEGGRRVCRQVEEITAAGIVVFGHIGLTPQSSGQLGGFKAQGLHTDSARELIEDALALEEAGCEAILIEAVPPRVTAFIADKLEIPVYSIGAGKECDGQLLICGDMLGMFEAFTPKFVKKYANLAEIEIDAFEEYIEDVKEGKFPKDEHVYNIRDSEEKFEEMFDEFR